MLQIFDCASLIVWCLPSHDATATLLVSQLRQYDIDLYRLPCKSIINTSRECQRGESRAGWLCARVCAIPAVPACLSPLLLFSQQMLL